MSKEGCFSHGSHLDGKIIPPRAFLLRKSSQQRYVRRESSTRISVLPRSSLPLWTFDNRFFTFDESDSACDRNTGASMEETVFVEAAPPDSRAVIDGNQPRYEDLYIRDEGGEFSPASGIRAGITARIFTHTPMAAGHGREFLYARIYTLRTSTRTPLDSFRARSQVIGNKFRAERES